MADGIPESERKRINEHDFENAAGIATKGKVDGGTMIDQDHAMVETPTLVCEETFLWYQPIWHLIVVKANQKGNQSAEQIDEACERVLERLREHPALEAMDWDQRAAWKDRELYGELFPKTGEVRESEVGSGLLGVMDIEELSEQVQVSKPLDVIDAEYRPEPLQKRKTLQKSQNVQKTLNFQQPGALLIAPYMPYTALPVKNFANRSLTANALGNGYAHFRLPIFDDKNEALTKKAADESILQRNGNTRTRTVIDELSKFDLTDIIENGGKPRMTKSMLDIRSLYEGKPIQQTALLNIMRPHSGILVTRITKKPQVGAVNHIAKIDLLARGYDVNTSGVDALLVIFRMLLSFGMNVDPVTTQDHALLEYAWMNWGWDYLSDWETKNAFVREALGIRAITPKFDQTFEDLIWIPRIQKLIFGNEAFGLICKHAGRRGDIISADHQQQQWNWKWLPKTYFKLVEQREPWIGNNTLQVYIDCLFHQTEIKDRVWYPFTLAPSFMRIDYHSTKKRRSYDISDIRTFQLKARTAWQDGRKKWYQGMQDTTYVLCAVVRLGNPKTQVRDDVRVYWGNGEELANPDLPCQSVNLTDKSQRLDKRMWSIKQPGRYMLFFNRMDSISEAGLQVIKDAPEFATRNWVQQLTDQELRDEELKAQGLILTDAKARLKQNGKGEDYQQISKLPEFQGPDIPTVTGARATQNDRWMTHDLCEKYLQNINLDNLNLGDKGGEDQQTPKGSEFQSQNMPTEPKAQASTDQRAASNNFETDENRSRKRGFDEIRQEEHGDDILSQQPNYDEEDTPCRKRARLNLDES